jgi:hypothetical protein
MKLQNENLTRKNQMLSAHIEKMKVDLEIILQDSAKIKDYREQYLKFKAEHPDEDLNTFVKRFHNLEHEFLIFQKKHSELEERALNRERESRREIEQLNRRVYEFQQKNQENDNLIENLKRAALIERNSNLVKDYKEEYLELFNQVVEAYAEISSQVKIYSVADEKKPKDVETPADMLRMLKKYLKITSTESTQDYIRKIIVSAKAMQRKHFPHLLHERFDPDVVYEAATKHISSLEAQIKRLKEELGEKAKGTNEKKKM